LQFYFFLCHFNNIHPGLDGIIIINSNGEYLIITLDNTVLMYVINHNRK
jgi:hypothetical protein